MTHHGRLDYTASVYLVANGEVLLVRHRELDLWLPPGGHIEDEETPDEAAHREVLEETGLSMTFVHGGWDVPEDKDANVTRLARPMTIQVEDIGRTHRHVDFIYVARPSSREVDLEIRALESFGWFDTRRLRTVPGIPPNVATNGRFALEIGAAE
jgi:8-oxo-dGTP pyrophosphatase MutT (NUDIX family)